MAEVACYSDDCKWFSCGFCQRGSITICEDLTCEDFECYIDSYKDSFYKACFKDGKKFRRLAEHGKKIEYNGYVFYTEDRVTEAEEYGLTEERTGVFVGSFKRLKGRWEKFVEKVVTYPDVLSYPIEEKKGE